MLRELGFNKKASTVGVERNELGRSISLAKEARVATRKDLENYFAKNPPKDPKKAQAIYNLAEQLKHGPVKVRLNKPLSELRRK